MRRGVAALGLCSWDRFLIVDRYPDAGGYAIVEHRFEQAGGTTANTCAALARLGVEVTIASAVGADSEGDACIEALDAAGCDTSLIYRKEDQATDSGIILVSDSNGTPERTILWIKGAQPRHGDKLPVEMLLDHHWLFLDVNDDLLRKFILSLPAHLSPRTKIAGAMTFLVDSGRETGMDHLLEHDVMFGNRRELMYLTGAVDLEDAIQRVQQRMIGSACQVIYLTLGDRGSLAIRPHSVIAAPAHKVDVVDTTGAGDAFAGGALSGLVEGLDDESILRRANAVGALCCTALGSRAGLPDMESVRNMIDLELARASDPFS